MPDISATPVPSRWLTTTIVPGPDPGRTAVTVSSALTPTAVSATCELIETLNPGSVGDDSTAATWWASD